MRSVFAIIDRCCPFLIFLLSTQGAVAGEKSSPFDGNWDVVFYARQFRAAVIDSKNTMDVIPIDSNLSLCIKKCLITISNDKEAMTLEIKSWKIDRNGYTTIDLIEPGSSGDNVWNGIIKIKDDRIEMRFPSQSGKERPKDFVLKSTDEGWMIAANRKPTKGERK